MKRFRFLVPFMMASIAIAPLRAETESIDLKALANKARPAVLLLVVYDAAGKEIATGTGFLVSSDGKLITNHHVIENAASIIAKAENGGLFPVEGVLAGDPKKDLVLLKLRGKDLPFLPLGNNDKIEVGTRIAAIGSPLGLEGTLSEGIVSAVRNLLEDVRMLQITAPISPGSSGSPVLDAKGEVIGVATSLIRAGQQLNFAVPVEFVRALLQRTGDLGKVRPFAEYAKAETDRIYEDTDYFIALLSVDDDPIGLLKASKELVRKYPDNAMAHFLQGMAFEKLAFGNDAITSFRQAIKLKPDFAEAWCNLGVAYDSLRHADEAISAYRYAIKLKPDLAVAWHNLATAFATSGHTNDAIAAYRKVTTVKPDDIPAWYALGWHCQKLGRYGEAVDAYRGLVNLLPENVDALCCLGYALLARANAISDPDQAVEADFKDALAVLKYTIKLHPKSAKAWKGLVLIYVRIDNQSEAQQAMAVLRKIDPELAAGLSEFEKRCPYLSDESGK